MTISDWIQIALLIAVIIYTVETRRLRVQSERQLRLLRHQARVAALPSIAAQVQPVVEEAVYFQENQKGSAKWDKEQHIVQVNRTEALDAAKKGIRDGAGVLPRRLPLIEEFAEHLASDAKKLIEDEETGAKSYKYIRTGTNHYSLAFTYDWIASERERRQSSVWIHSEPRPEDRPVMWQLLQDLRYEGLEWPPRWDKKF